MREPEIVGEDDDIHAVSAQQVCMDQRRVNPWRIIELYQKVENEKQHQHANSSG